MENYSAQRRELLSLLLRGSALSLLTTVPGINAQSKQLRSYTVADIMDLIIKEIPNAPSPDTVDTLKSGSKETVVTGIVTTMFPTIEVIRKAIGIRANLIIGHEPTFYNHRDNQSWVKDNDLIAAKAKLLADNNVTVWRLHDYWHSMTPDGITKGVLDKLEWTKFAKDKELLELPRQTLRQLITDVKLRLGLKGVRYIGNDSDLVSTVCLLPGAWGGQHQIETIQRLKPDVVLCGEISEWETGEYVRDLRAMGQKVSLVLLGHAPSEEPGMKWLETWLKPRVPGLKVNFIPSGSPFRFE